MDFSKFRKLTWLKSLVSEPQTDDVRLMVEAETAVSTPFTHDLITKSQLKAGCAGKGGGEDCGCGAH